MSGRGLAKSWQKVGYNNQLPKHAAGPLKSRRDGDLSVAVPPMSFPCGLGPRGLFDHCAIILTSMSVLPVIDETSVPRLIGAEVGFRPV